MMNTFRGWVMFAFVSYFSEISVEKNESVAALTGKLELESSKMSTFATLSRPANYNEKSSNVSSPNKEIFKTGRRLLTKSFKLSSSSPNREYLQ